MMMNISKILSGGRSSVRQVRIIVLLAVFGAGACAHVSAETSRSAEKERPYGVFYVLEIEAGNDTASASIRVEQNVRRLRELSFNIDEDRLSNFSGDGEVTQDDGRLTWKPPREGGTLRYDAVIPQKRRSGKYDARMTDDWALFRIGDMFPPAATRTSRDAESVAELELTLPDDWSALTPYLSGDDKFSFPFDNPERRFDRPTGWVLLGSIGVRRGKIADTRVAIGSPTGENFHRMDVMAFLNWTLPGIREVFSTLDDRLVIVSAGDPMWRGGLSGPGSLYMHADRPLISENGTSTLLHELVHVAMGVSGSAHDDWIVEGLAEYYSIKILRTTNTLSERRMELALADLKEWGKDVDDLFVRRASGEVTAKATTVLAELDAYLRSQSSDAHSLDDVVALMIERGDAYSYPALCAATRDVLDAGVPLLAATALPGAPDVENCAAER